MSSKAKKLNFDDLDPGVQSQTQGDEDMPPADEEQLPKKTLSSAVKKEAGKVKSEHAGSDAEAEPAKATGSKKRKPATKTVKKEPGAKKEEEEEDDDEGKGDEYQDRGDEDGGKEGGSGGKEGSAPAGTKTKHHNSAWTPFCDRTEGSRTNPETGKKRHIKDWVQPKKKPRTDEEKAKIASGELVPRKLRPGAGAIKEIERLQDTVDLFVPFAAWYRLVREVADEVTGLPMFQGTEVANGVRIQEGAVLALQHGAENWLTDVFKAAQKQAISSGRKNPTDADFHTVLDNMNNLCKTNLR